MTIPVKHLCSLPTHPQCPCEQSLFTSSQKLIIEMLMRIVSDPSSAHIRQFCNGDHQIPYPISESHFSQTDRSLQASAQRSLLACGSVQKMPRQCRSSPFQGVLVSDISGPEVSSRRNRGGWRRESRSLAACRICRTSPGSGFEKNIDSY